MNGVKYLAIFIITIFLLSFIYATEGSFTISSNESQKYKQLPKTKESPKEKDQEKETCLKQWDCNEWGMCIGFFQTRECIDTNHCTDKIKTERRFCVPKGVEEFLEKEIPLIHIKYWMFLLLILLTLLAIIIRLWLKIRKQKKKIKKLKTKIKNIKDLKPRRKH